MCDKYKDFLLLTKLETQLTLVRDGLDCSHFLPLWKGHPSMLFYHLSGDSRISLWERDKRIEGCREQAHRYVLLIKHKMGESPRTWAWIMHVKVWGGRSAKILRWICEETEGRGGEEALGFGEGLLCWKQPHFSANGTGTSHHACFSIATHTCGLFAAADLSLSLYPDYCSLTVDRMWHNGLHKNPWLYYTGARKWKRHTHTLKKTSVFCLFDHMSLVWSSDVNL